jgi:HAD superfamily hydrolase (TIGR01509 family)
MTGGSGASIGAIVFDLWGTLMSERREVFRERARLRYEGVRPVLDRHGIEVELEDFTRTHLESNRMIGLMQNEGRDVSAEERARHVVYQLAPHAADRLDERDLETFVEAYSGAVVSTPPELLDGAVEALDGARERGLGVGLISNTGVSSGRHLREVFKAAGILDRFDSLIFSDELGRAKPHREVFERAAGELEVDAASAVFIGDTPRFDVGPPRRYGWWVVQVGHREDGDPPAHRRVESVGEVFDALADLGLVPR